MALRRIAVHYDVISPYSWVGFEQMLRHERLWNDQVYSINFIRLIHRFVDIRVFANLRVVDIFGSLKVQEVESLDDGLCSEI